MDEQRVSDEFRRVEVVTELERLGRVLAMYRDNDVLHQDLVGDLRYELGKLDQRLGGGA